MKKAFVAAMAGSAVLACGADKPGRLDNYTLGASFRETDSIAGLVESRSFACLPDVGTYRECWLQSPHNYGFTILTLDTGDRVTMIRQKLDSAEFRRNGIDTIGLHAKRGFLTAQWSQIGEQRSIVAGPPAIETWAPRDGSWTAVMVTDQLEKTGYLSEIVVREKDTRDYLNARAALAADSADMARATSSTSPVVRAMRAELARVIDAQRALKESSGRYVGSLHQLHFIPKPDHVVAVGSGGPDGWWARIHARDDVSTVCYVWFGAPEQPLHLRARAGTIPEMPYCRSAEIQPETQFAASQPSRIARNTTLPGCPTNLARLRTLDPLDTNRPDVVAQPAGVFATPGVQNQPRHGRVISLWQVGRRWHGTTQIWTGASEPIEGVISDGYSSDDGSTRFRVVYDDSVFDSYHVSVGDDLLQGRAITAHERCPGKQLALENLALVKDANASAAQPAIPPR